MFLNKLLQKATRRTLTEICKMVAALASYIISWKMEIFLTMFFESRLHCVEVCSLYARSEA